MAGRIEEGLAAVNLAIRAAKESGERVFEAELYRVRGELMLASVRDDRTKSPEVRRKMAARSFRRSIKIAQTQGAKCFELRSTIALCRLFHVDEKKRSKVKQLLTKLYCSFSESRETSDLQEAQSLIREISVSQLPIPVRTR